MKKVYHSIDIQQKQGHELSKKLYRSISEQAKRLDDSRSCVRTIGDLFCPSLQAQRRKFCDYCERLIFSEPLLYGKKGEELLWRKGYYDVVAVTKRLKKNEYTPEEVACFQAHINAGIGFYCHVISKLQCEFRLDLKGMIDFAIYEIDSDDKHDDISNELTEWAIQAVHQCLIYLGDLSRYKLEIYPNWEPHLAIRYYLQAISFKPDYGMPHNQMGTLAMSRNNYLDAVYHYLRCLACKFSFDGTTNNLHGLFETNAKYIEQIPDNRNDENADCIIEPGRNETIKQFLARFLLLIDIWYFNKKVTKIYSLCHQTYKNLEECLLFSKSTVNSESGDTPTTDSDSVDTESIPGYLTGDMLFKMASICLLCISKLKKNNSPQLSTLVAFTLGIYSQILQSIMSHIQEAVLNYPLPEESKPSSKKGNGLIKDLMNGGKKRSKSSKLRRRKALIKEESDEESDMSEAEENGNADYMSSSDDDSFMSDTEDVLAESSDEEIDNEKPVNGTNSDGTSLLDSISKPSVESNGKDVDVKKSDDNKSKEDVLKKSQRMDVNDMLEIISEDAVALQSVKILNDWLKTDVEVLKSCGQNTRSLIRQIVHLINLININISHIKIPGIDLKMSEVIKKEAKIPLSEDVVLKGLDILQTVQTEYDWEYMVKKSLTSKWENLIRIVKLISFGKFLSGIEETGVFFDENKNIFLCKSDDKTEENGISATAVMEELERQEQESAAPTNGLRPLHASTNGEIIKPNNNNNGGQLNKMKHMGQLWLAAEVRALETRVGSGKPALSPYLVLDADALIKYTNMVKSLVYSRKFIVLVPAAVVSALDDLKREKLEARDAIRWLESQFHRGNRFFRAQRPHERAAIPFIKFPKKKDKEMHVYIQIVECCHFLAKQQQNASDVVTLLVGNHNILNGENKDFSYAGLAQSIGVAVESIPSFHGKWKKNKGNR